MTGHRLSEKSHSLDGTKTIGQINRELQDVYDGQPMTAGCAFCDWSFTGTAVAGREAAAFHRSTEHPEQVNGRSPRDLLNRMDAGESVAVAPIPASTCKREGCTEPPKATRGRYALLCEAHTEERQVVGNGGRIPAWSKDTIIAAIQRWATEHGAPPTANSWSKKQDGCPACSTVLKHFGSWANAIEAAGFPRPVRGGQRAEPVAHEVQSDASVFPSSDEEPKPEVEPPAADPPPTQEPEPSEDLELYTLAPDETRLARLLRVEPFHVFTPSEEWVSAEAIATGVTDLACDLDDLLILHRKVKARIRETLSQLGEGIDELRDAAVEALKE
jgi:hypothetical protein